MAFKEIDMSDLQQVKIWNFDLALFALSKKFAVQLTYNEILYIYIYFFFPPRWVGC